MSARSEAGYTLLELIVALSMSTIVLVGVFSMMGTVVHYQVEGLKKETVTTWSLASLVAMNKEIEGSSVLVYPTSGGSGDSLIVCSNWSRLRTYGGAGAVLNGGTPDAYYYCFDSTNQVLRRKTANSCPASPATPPNCDTANYGTGNILATNVYRNGAANVFQADPNMAGTVRLQYVIGNPSPTSLLTNPASLTFDTKVTLDRQYGNASD